MIIKYGYMCAAFIDIIMKTNETREMSLGTMRMTPRVAVYIIIMVRVSCRRKGNGFSLRLDGKSHSAPITPLNSL